MCLLEFLVGFFDCFCLIFFKIASVPHAVFLFSRARGTTLSSSALKVSLDELNKMSFAIVLWKNIYFSIVNFQHLDSYYFASLNTGRFHIYF